jgi:leucyl aminopeptidase
VLFEVFRNFFINHRQVISSELLVDLRHLSENVTYQCVLGTGLSDYSTGTYKTEDQKQLKLPGIRLLVNRLDSTLESSVEEAIQTSEVVKRICALVDAPGNIKTPAYLAQWAIDSGRQYSYQVEVLDHRELQAQNLLALLAVGQGSVNQPLLIKIQYKHPDLDPSKTQLGLVGKGVTFDTGGLSIKKATNMHYMKSDMGGAAAVLGAMELVARLKLRMNIDAVIPVAENSVDAKSIRPGDVIGSYAGKSIEVIDTDAEGRLILADGLSYIQQQSDPEMLVDLATLTGSCVATLGYHAAGLFSNNDPLADQLTIAGELSGERVWRLPIWESYADELQSDVADIKNLSGQPVAGAITAAKFLEAFVREKQQWAHLDIAGVAFGSTDHAKMKSATGYGVRLLLEFIKSLILTKSR